MQYRKSSVCHPSPPQLSLLFSIVVHNDWQATLWAGHPNRQEPLLNSFWY